MPRQARDHYRLSERELTHAMVPLVVIVLFAGATVVFAAQNFQLIAVFLRINIQLPLAFLIAVIYLLDVRDMSAHTSIAVRKWTPSAFF